MKNQEFFRIPMEMEIDNPTTFAKIMNGDVNINSAVARTVLNGRINEYIKLSPKIDNDSGVKASLGSALLGAAFMGGAWMLCKGVSLVRSKHLNKQVKRIAEELSVYGEKLDSNTMTREDYDELLALLDKINMNKKLRDKLFAVDEIYDLLYSLAFSQRREEDQSDDTNERQKTMILLNAFQYLLKQKEQDYAA